MPQSLSFSRSGAGKPHLAWNEEAGEADPQGLQFNLSHTPSLLGTHLLQTSCLYVSAHVL